MHIKTGRFHPYSNPKAAEFLVVSDFVESFLLIAPRTIAEKEPSSFSPGKQYNKVSHFALN